MSNDKRWHDESNVNAPFEWLGNTDPDDKSGVATYRLAGGEVSLRIGTFAEASRLSELIRAQVELTRFEARAGLLAEIARIRP